MTMTTKSRQCDLQPQNLVIEKGVKRILTDLFLSNPETQQFFHSLSWENGSFYHHGILHTSGWLSVQSKRKCFACSADTLKLTRWWRSPCTPNQHLRTVVSTTTKRHWKSLHSMKPQWLIERSCDEVLSYPWPFNWEYKDLQIDIYGKPRLHVSG